MTRVSKSIHPRQLLLATDLSPRGDRALERAMQLAAQWGAELHVVNVIENELLPDPYLRREIATREGEAEAMVAPLAKRAGIGTRVHVVVGGAASAVIETAMSKRVGLVVMAPAAYEAIATVVLGSTVERVLRHAEQPVLVVKRRCAGPYRSILVAVDLSDASALALRRALELFPGARFTVVHAFETPFSAFMASASLEPEMREAHLTQLAALIERETARFSGAEPPKISAVIESGRADEAVGRHLVAAQADLVVLGTHGLTGVRRAVIGSTCERLIETLPCDVLAVRPPT